MFDVIIIGGGPAGISAGIYLIRGGLSVLVLAKNKGHLDNTEITIDNYYGTPNIKGNELVNSGISQYQQLGGKINFEEVIFLKSHTNFEIITKTSVYLAKTLILATGIKNKKSKLPNYEHLIGHGISKCATCDGFFFKGLDVSIVGNNDYMEHEKAVLEKLAKSVTVFTNNVSYDKKANHEQIISFSQSDDKIKITTANSSYLYDGVFIADSEPSANEFANILGISMENNQIIVDDNCQTNINRIYAIGDVTGEPKQIIKAVYQGMKAALHIIKNKN